MTVRLLACAAWLLASLPGCAAENAVAPPPADLVGSWTWLSSSGGIGGVTETPQSTGSTRRIVFRADGVYEEYRNDTLRGVTGFFVSRDSTMFHPGVGDVITYADGRTGQEPAYAGSDTLILADRCLDCFVHLYRHSR